MLHLICMRNFSFNAKYKEAALLLPLCVIIVDSYTNIMMQVSYLVIM